MLENLVTRLQAMYHSGQVSSFIVSSLPQDELSIGWIENGLTGKGFKGSIQDKEIQESLIIPVDRFIRLILETEPYSHGLFILGNHETKLVSFLVGDEPSTVVGFTSGKIQVSELISMIGQILIGRFDSTYKDANLDYIEQLISDSASGNVTKSLSISLLSAKSKPTTWIKKILKTDLTSKDILTKSGNPLELSPPIPLLTRWLVGLDIFKRTQDTISSLLLIRDSEILLYFWDDNLQVVTFASIEGLSLEQVLNQYMYPLWFTPTKVSKAGPKVIIEETKVRHQHVQSASGPIVKDSQSLSIVRTRLLELISRISPLVSEVGQMKSRLVKLVKDRRTKSMEELSYDAIEELRRIEDDMKTIASISSKLREIEKEIEDGNVPLNPDDLQQIAAKMTSLRTLIDKIEIEIGHLDKKSSEIETLKFKRRTES